MRTSMASTALIVLALAAWVSGEAAPGSWLRDQVEERFPLDWSFTRAHAEVVLEVATPFRLRHRVAIRCAEVGGRLYVGTRNWESRHWPAWVDGDPRVRLRVAQRIYHARLEPVTDPELSAVLADAYAAKYRRSEAASSGSQRYWQVKPRVRRSA
jgi:hypothetical protein